MSHLDSASVASLLPGPTFRAQPIAVPRLRLALSVFGTCHSLNTSGASPRFRLSADAPYPEPVGNDRERSPKPG